MRCHKCGINSINVYPVDYDLWLCPTCEDTLRELIEDWIQVQVIK